MNFLPLGIKVHSIILFEKFSNFLVSKLPANLRDRWNRKVQMVGISFGRETYLSDFASFVHEEATLVNDPRILYWNIFRLLKRNTIRKRNMEILPQKGGSGKMLSE